MKAKNAKVGTKVVVKKGVSERRYKEGQTGTIDNIDSGYGYYVGVNFDHDGNYWCVGLDELKLLNKKEKRND